MAAQASSSGLATLTLYSARQGRLIEGAIRAILADLRLSPEQEALVSTVVPFRLREIARRDGDGWRAAAGA
jgi:hypothetical protein